MKQSALRVEAGMDATAISATVAGAEYQSRALRQPRFTLPERCYYALRHSERYRSRAAETLMDIVRGRGPRPE